MQDLSGTTIRGYQMEERIGRGGFGAVYRAMQPVVGREVAVKVILPDFASQPFFIRRFEMEAQLVARLEHPFIVPLFDYWRDPSGAYLVMRFLRGGSLRDWLEAGRRLDRDTLFKAFEQVGGALTAAHRAGVVHRDLKPDNILLDDERNAYLSDFGIATQIAQEEEEEPMLAGSPGYMAPEQIRMQPVSPRTDIYALGYILYECLTGSHPYPDAGASELMYKQIRDPLPDLSEVDNPLAADANPVIQRATRKKPEERYEDVPSFLRALRDVWMGEGAGAATLVDLGVVSNPYKGLRPFDESDSADFFGREALIERLLDRLRETGPASRFLAVVGPSGSGKSSVVNAGLLPAIRMGGLPGSGEWFVAQMKPGASPLARLEQELLSLSSADIASLSEDLRYNKLGLLNAARLLLPPGAELLIIIDQFEEVFTLCDSEEERAQFLDLLEVAAGAEGSPLRVIITLRADFYDRPLMDEGFGDLMRQRTEVVLPMSTTEMERAITGPAERVGLMVDPNLLGAIIADLREEPGALPLLQYVLTELYERRSGRLLTLEAYQASGGALGALARRAEELLSGMDADGQALTRQLFLRLVMLGEGSEDTRRRVPYAELMALGSDAERVQAVLDAFGRYRLLSFDHDAETREPVVEVAHEALIRSWTRLREWLNESREDLRLQRRLATLATEWRKAGGETSFLLSGARLAQYEEWQGRTDLVLTEAERAYLARSSEQHQAAQRAEAERQARERALEQRAAARLRLLVAVLAVAFVVALILTAFAFSERSAAENARSAEESARIAAERSAAEAQSFGLAASARDIQENDPALALYLALEANRIDSSPSTQRALLDLGYAPGPLFRVDAGQGTALDAAAAQNASFALTLYEGGQVARVDLDAARIAQTFEVGEAQVLALGPQDEVFYVGGAAGALAAYDASSGARLRDYAPLAAAVEALALRPDGAQLAAGGEGVLAFYARDSVEPRLLLDTLDFVVTALAWLPDGAQLLVGSDAGTIYLMDASTGAIVRSYDEHIAAVNALTARPDGQRFLSASDDTEILEWQMDSEEVNRRFSGHTDAVTSVAYARDARFIVSAGADQRVLVWLARSRAILRDFSGHAGHVEALALAADGRRILSAGADGALIAWDMHHGALTTLFEEATTVFNAAALSPDGTRALSDSTENELLLWDVSTGALLARWPAHEDFITSVAFSPADGTRAVSTSWDGTAIVWDLAAQAALFTLEGHEDALSAAAFSPDGAQLVTASSDATLIVWDAASGDEIHRLEGHEDEVIAVAYSPDGARIASAGADQVVLLWDAASGELVQRLEGGHTDWINALAYSPDGATLASGGWDARIVLWDTASGTQARALTWHRGTVYRLVWEDSAHLLSASADRSIVRWDVAQGAPQVIYRQHLEDVIALDLLPQGAGFLSAGFDGLLALWRLESFEDALSFIEAQRYTRAPDCLEAIQYRLPLPAGCE